MGPRLRKLTLTAHTTCSVSWLGGVAAFIPLAVIGITSQQPQVVRTVDLGLDWIGWFVLVPLSLASLLTGVILSLGTDWGLFRHYWVLAKLALNVFGSGALLEYMLQLDNTMRGEGRMAGAGDMGLPRFVGALAVLLVPVVLSVYKPRGVTPYGWWKQRQRRMVAMRQRRAPVE